MKAWVLHDIGELCYEDIKMICPAQKEVLVKVRAAGICGSDIPRIYRDGAHKMPLIPGHEFSGEVVQTGKWTDEKWLHKRVGVYPLIPCRECEPCQREQYELCRYYSYLGSRRNGGFAEYAVVPENNLIELPADISYEAAAMLEPMAVAVHAMRRVQSVQTDTIAICGLGTIGTLLVMFLLQKGFRNVLAIGNKAVQEQALYSLGLAEENYCDSKKQNVDDWLKQRTNGQGANVFYECVGKNETFLQALNLTVSGGSVCLVGNPYGDMALKKEVYWKILRNQLTVTGTWNSSFIYHSPFSDNAESFHEWVDDWHYTLSLLKTKKIFPEKLISHKFTLPELEQGFHIMRDKSESYLKIMAIL